MDLITNQLLKARELRDNDGNVRSTSSAQQRKTNQSQRVSSGGRLGSPGSKGNQRQNSGRGSSQGVRHTTTDTTASIQGSGDWTSQAGVKIF